MACPTKLYPCRHPGEPCPDASLFIRLILIIVHTVHILAYIQGSKQQVGLLLI
jgi:hypothetical protein